MDLRQVFVANLRRLRHERGMSQEDLAYAADVNRTYLSKLEKEPATRIWKSSASLLSY
jgi:transcriptional regulator with XRE-family HTH domain